MLQDLSILVFLIQLVPFIAEKTKMLCNNSLLPTLIIELNRTNLTNSAILIVALGKLARTAFEWILD